MARNTAKQHPDHPSYRVELLPPGSHQPVALVKASGPNGLTFARLPSGDVFVVAACRGMDMAMHNNRHNRAAYCRARGIKVTELDRETARVHRELEAAERKERLERLEKVAAA